MATATHSNVSASSNSVELLATNADRVRFSVWNDSSSVLYLKYGSGASATSCATKILPGGYFESPVAESDAIYGIWESAVGAARLVEFE